MARALLIVHYPRRQDTGGIPREAREEGLNMSKAIAGVLAVAILMVGAPVSWGKGQEKDKAQDKAQTQSAQAKDLFGGVGALGVTWE